MPSGKTHGRPGPEGNAATESARSEFRLASAGSQFSTYGTLWIRQALHEGCEPRSDDPPRRCMFPAPDQGPHGDSKLSTRLGREATYEEIAAEAKIDVERSRRCGDAPWPTLDHRSAKTRTDFVTCSCSPSDRPRAEERSERRAPGLSRARWHVPGGPSANVIALRLRTPVFRDR